MDGVVFFPIDVVVSSIDILLTSLARAEVSRRFSIGTPHRTVGVNSLRAELLSVVNEINSINPRQLEAVFVDRPKKVQEVGRGGGSPTPK